MMRTSATPAYTSSSLTPLSLPSSPLSEKNSSVEAVWVRLRAEEAEAAGRAVDALAEEETGPSGWLFRLLSSSDGAPFLVAAAVVLAAEATVEPAAEGTAGGGSPFPSSPSTTDPSERPRRKLVDGEAGGVGISGMEGICGSGWAVGWSTAAALLLPHTPPIALS